LIDDTLWPLPASWRWCRFDEVARVASNLVSPSDFQNWPHIAPNHIESATGRLLPYDTIAHDGVTSPKHRFLAGQVLYSKIRPYLAKVVADFDGLCSADMYPIESELDARFLKWWMLTREFTRRAAGEQARTVLPKINVHALSGLPVPVPPSTEQRRIVEILEDHLSRLGAAARSLDVVAYRSRSLLLSQLAREFRPSSGAESTLGAVADWGSGGTPKARTPTFYEGGEIPWVVSGELKDDVLTEVAGRITQEGLKESSAKWVPAGALLVAMYGATIGRLALTTEPVTTNQAVAHALPHQDVVTAEYMFWFLLSQRRLLVAAGQGGAQPNISQTVLKAWPIRIPALRVQAEAVLAAHSLRDSTRRLQSSAQALHARQGLLRGALLSAAFTGRLTGRAADDEVVEELANV